MTTDTTVAARLTVRARPATAHRVTVQLIGPGGEHEGLLVLTHDRWSWYKAALQDHADVVIDDVGTDHVAD